MLGLIDNNRSVDTDSKVTCLETLILRKVKEIGPIPTTRFQGIDLTCVIG